MIFGMPTMSAALTEVKVIYIQVSHSINPLNPMGRFYGFEVPLSANRWKC
jgi:hypothetical protein